jgi:hypothetical protein
MGAVSTTKIIVNNAGSLTENTTLTTSAGAADANKLPALNAAGILDLTIVNAKNASAGAGDAGKVVALDAGGRIDSTMMPSGIGAETALIMTSEAIASGDLVNIYNNAGTANVRKADASTSGKEAMGFVLVGVSSGVLATVQFEGANTAVTALTPGPQFLSAATAGKTVTVAPTGTGRVVQKVGFASSATSMSLNVAEPIVLA